jgi:hypothetical protein
MLIDLYQPDISAIWMNKSSEAADCAMSFFLSYEDALWSLLLSRSAQKQAQETRVLLPDYYCMETVEFLRKRGCEILFYPVDAQLCHDEDAFYCALQDHQPDLIVLYHILGREPKLKHDLKWLTLLKPDAILIEDCAHCLLDHKQIRFLCQYHYYIDSLRKVSPLQGARIFAAQANLLPSVGWHWDLHRWHTAWLYLMWRMSLQGVRFLHNIRIPLFGHKAISRALWQYSEYLFELHNERVGGADRPLAGFLIDQCLVQHIDLCKIKAHKRWLGVRYHAMLSRLSQLSPQLRPIAFDEGDWESLKFYPIAISKTESAKLLNFLAQRNIYLDVLYPDSPHCQERDYLMLPMSLHTKSHAIEELCFALHRYMELT